MSAVTAAQLAAAVKTATAPMFSFQSAGDQVTAVLHAAWPDVPMPEIPDDAHDAALAAALAAVHATPPPQGEESVLAALNAAAPHMPA